MSDKLNFVRIFYLDYFFNFCQTIDVNISSNPRLWEIIFRFIVSSLNKDKVYVEREEDNRV